MFRKLFHGLVYIFALIGFGLTVGYFGVKFGLTNTTGIVDNQRQSFLAGVLPAVTPAEVSPSTTNTQGETSVTTGPEPVWAQTPEWSIIDQAVRRDAPDIQKAANDSGVPARLIAANLIGEQLRLFFTERDFYKQIFSPLKILGSQTQFSWGVMGMKEETAILVENNLKDTSSPYYPGPTFVHFLDFSSQNVSGERFARMTDSKNHYWSYLYAGLYLREIEQQWASAGYDIQNHPDVLSTLYNIGFAHSTPNPTPQVGGAEIDVGGQTYSFGGIAADFYNSDLLTDVFPR